MARRRGNKLLAGLGEGISNLGLMLYRNQTQDRMDQRAADAQKAVMDRTTKTANEAFKSQVLQSVAKNELDPQQAAVILAARTGEHVDPMEFEQARPPAHRRMEGMMGEISKADLGGLPTDDAIRFEGQKQGLLDTQFAGPMPEGEEDFAGFAPAVRDTAKVSGARRKSLMNKPEWADYEDPITGVKGKRTISMGDPMAASGISLGPTAEQRGALKGTEDATALEVSGPAKAAQAELESAAGARGRQGVEFSPEGIKGAAAKAGAETRAKLGAELAQYGITGQQQTAALQLADDFYTQSKDYFTQADAIKKISASAQRIQSERKAGGDSPAANIALVFNFMKMLDPTSTVREGEQAQASQAAGVPDRILAQYNRIVNGGRLTDGQVNDFLNTAAAQYRSADTDHRGRITDFTNRATMLRVPPALVVREPDPSLLNIGQSAKSKWDQR